MEWKGRPRWKLALLVAFVGIGGALVFRQFQVKQGLPELAFPDLNANRQAGTCDQVVGTALTKLSTPPELATAKLATPVPVSGTGGWSQVAQGGGFVLGALFHVRPQGRLQLQTAGNWIIAMDGEGEFALEDARRDEGARKHTIQWFVKKGVFRAKPHDYDTSDHWILVRTPEARVLVHKGEIGLRLSDGGKGQIWLVSGEAEVIWNDGRRKQLALKGMDYL